MQALRSRSALRCSFALLLLGMVAMVGCSRMPVAKPQKRTGDAQARLANEELGSDPTLAGNEMWIDFPLTPN